MRGLARVLERVFGKADGVAASAPRVLRDFSPALQSYALDGVYLGPLANTVNAQEKVDGEESLPPTRFKFII